MLFSGLQETCTDWKHCHIPQGLQRCDLHGLLGISVQDVQEHDARSRCHQDLLICFCQDFFQTLPEGGQPVNIHNCEQAAWYCSGQILAPRLETKEGKFFIDS